MLSKNGKFGCATIKALGHKLSGLELAVYENKVAAVGNFPSPTCVRDIQCFLGLIGYHRQFIKDSANMARPVYELPLKDVVFEMTEASLKAWTNLKQAIIQSPVLGTPDFDKPFKPYVDASLLGLGGVLQQEQIIDGVVREVFICFISRSLRNGELNYGATQLECLSLFRALEKLHYYLDGEQLSIITDCNAIRS